MGTNKKKSNNVNKKMNSESNNTLDNKTTNNDIKEYIDEEVKRKVEADVKELLSNNMDKDEFIIKESNKLLNFLLVILIVIVLVLAGFIVWDKFIKNDTSIDTVEPDQYINNDYINEDEQSNSKEQGSKEEKEISLSKDKKIAINKQLMSLSNILSSNSGFIVIGGNLTTPDNITYGINYLDNEYYKMMFVKSTGKTEDDGIVYTSLEDAKKSYEEIFIDKFDLDKILKSVKSYELFGDTYDEKVYYNQSLVYNTKSNNFYKLIYTSPNYYYLKATKLTYNENEKIYTLTCDVLAQSIKDDNDIYYKFRDGSYEYQDASSIEYPNNLVYNKLNVKYKEVDGLNKLVSLIFEKK